MASSCGRVYMVQPTGDGEVINSSSEARSSGITVSAMSHSDMLQLISVDDAVMMNDGNECHDDQVLQLCEAATVLVVDPHGHQQPMHVPSQNLRDQVMSSLANAQSATGPCHGTQEGNDREEDREATTNRALRLQPHSSGGSARSTDGRSAMLRPSPSASTRSGIQDRIQQVRNMGVLRNMPLETVLHAGLRRDGGHEEGRTPRPGHEDDDLQDPRQRAGGQPQLEEREDLPGRRREQPSQEDGERAEEEGAVGAVATALGDQGHQGDHGLRHGIYSSIGQGHGQCSGDSDSPQDPEARGDSGVPRERSDRSGGSGRRLDTNPF